MTPMNSKYDQLFAKLTLPVRPDAAVDGAAIQLIEGEAEAPQSRSTPFFGGYAEDFLGDMGFESVTSSTEATIGIRKAK
jgi:hypothetical protein